MNSVTIGIASSEDVRARIAAALRGESQGQFISFPSVDLLWKVLTAKRWDILKVMTGAGALTIREIARRVGRDVKAVHGDVQALLDAGILTKSEDRKVVFPFDSVHVDFTLAAA